MELSVTFNLYLDSNDENFCVTTATKSPLTVRALKSNVQVMLKDSQGLKVTTDSPDVIAAVDHFIDQSLSYGKDAKAILQGIKADPTCVIANVYVATISAWKAPRLGQITPLRKL